MKTFLKVTALGLLLCAGCSTTNITKLVKELSKDPATVAVSIQSVYGTVYLLRTVDTNRIILIGPISIK